MSNNIYQAPKTPKPAGHVAWQPHVYIQLVVIALAIYAMASSISVSIWLLQNHPDISLYQQGTISTETLLWTLFSNQQVQGIVANVVGLGAPLFFLHRRYALAAINYLIPSSYFAYTIIYRPILGVWQQLQDYLANWDINAIFLVLFYVYTLSLIGLCFACAYCAYQNRKHVTAH